MRYYVIFSHEEKNSILQKYTQNEHLLISTFLFLSFYLRTICKFAFVKIQMQITFAVILCFKQQRLVGAVNKHFDCLII